LHSSSVSITEPRYRLDRLGWAQFERFCAEVFGPETGVARRDWHGRADRTAIARVSAGLSVPGDRRALAGPALLCALWVRPSIRAPQRWRFARRSLTTALAEERARWPVRPEAPVSVLVLVNIEPEPSEFEALTATIARALGNAVDVAVAGPRALGAAIERRADLRRRLPSLLGVREPAECAARDVVERSTADHEAAIALARIFVPTRAHALALDVLERHGFAVITGPPEMGKTAIARMVGLALMTEGWEVHECIRPDDVWARFDRQRRQLFIADDAFGSTEYRPEAAERWALELDRVLRAMDDRHWLIWTSRPGPLNAGLRRIHREHGVERFPKPAEIHVDAADLEIEEKALILFRHARNGHLSAPPATTVQAQGWAIVSHPHFTPERIRRFVADRLPELAQRADRLSSRELSAAVEAEIREPTTAMATSLRALSAEHQALLVALLDTPPDPVPERELAAAVRRHSEAGFPRPPAELVDRLADHFLRVVPPTSVTWVHPSWRDLVIDELANDPARRRRFLERCSLHGVLLAVSTAGGQAGERTFPLLVDDHDWDLLGDRVYRVVSDLDDPDLLRLLAALDAAVEAAPSVSTRHEAEALSVTVLSALRARWNGDRCPVLVALLAFWFALASKLDDPPEAPDVAATWIELMPVDWINPGSESDLRRFDQWLQLAAVLVEHQPDLVASEFGFPHRHVDVIRSFVDDAAAVAEAGQPSATLASCLRRLEQVVPELAAGALRTAVALERRDEPEEWLMRAPRREPPPPERSIVSRILSDLEPEPNA
jgi:hypothetical protein